MNRTSRVLPFERIYNFRDFGDYTTSSGGRLRKGVLLRSAHHGEATDVDLNRLASLKLNTIVDLRGASERAQVPCRRPSGFDSLVIVAEAETVDPAMAAASAEVGAPRGIAIESVQDAHKVMLAIYAALPFDAAMVSLLTRYLDVLVNTGGASLVHCMAGKDRTGFAVALVHHLVGVHRDDALEDYMASNVAPHREAWIERTRERYSGNGILPPDDAFATVLSVAPEFLASAFDAIIKRHGTVDAYLEDSLGITAVRRETLCANLLG